MEQDKKLHICHILFTSKIGGLEQAYIDYTRALLLRGHKITAIILPNAPYRAQLTALNVEIITLKIRGFYNVFSWLALRRITKKTNPDLVLVHNGRAIFASAKAMIGQKIPLIGVSHSYNTKYSKKSEHLLVLTEGMRKHFVDAGYDAKKCAVMNNMIDLTDIPEARILEKNTLPTIGFMGRLVPEKGANQLISAIALLKQKNELVNLLIAGCGEEENNLRAQAENMGISAQIKFMGWIEKEEKTAFFKNIDVLCIPSLSETFGLVVLEAWKNYVPVIAAKTGGLAEIIENEKTGLHYPKGDIHALAENIEKILFSEKNLRQELADNGREEVKKYGFEESAKRLDKLLFYFIPQPHISSQI